MLLGPGRDGKTIAPEGLSAARMSADQRAGLMRLIGRYTVSRTTRTVPSGRRRFKRARRNVLRVVRANDAGQRGLFSRDGAGIVIEYAAQGPGRRRRAGA